MIFRVSSCSSRYAILGAGFAGISVAWHLLKVKSLNLILFLCCCEIIASEFKICVVFAGESKRAEIKC